jgi:uncharacterized protein involved in outer membrane biogenesis
MLRIRRFGVIAGVAILLLVVAAGIFHMALVRMVRRDVEKRTSELMGVKATVDNASVSILKQRVRLGGFSLANPEGFTSPVMYTASRVDISIDLWSVRRGEIIVREAVVERPRLTVEFSRAGTNWDVVAARLARLHAKRTDDGKRIRVERVVMRRGIAKMAHAPLLGDIETEIPDIEIAGINAPDGSGLPVAGVLLEVIKRSQVAIMADVVRAAAGRSAPRGKAAFVDTP